MTSCLFRTAPRSKPSSAVLKQCCKSQLALRFIAAASSKTLFYWRHEPDLVSREYRFYKVATHMNSHESHEPSRQIIAYPRPNKPLVLPAPQGDATGEEGLAEYWRVLVKRRWTILGVAVTLTALVVG